MVTGSNPSSSLGEDVTAMSTKKMEKMRGLTAAQGGKEDDDDLLCGV